MDLQQYLSELPRGKQCKFAEEIHIAHSFLCNIAKGRSKAPIPVAKRIEVATGGLVPKHKIRPDVWEVHY